MRKVTKTICTAFINGESKTIKNTATDGAHLMLHGNIIATRNTDGTIYLTLAGWNSVTTRDRLNGLLRLMGLPFGFTQKDYGAYFVAHGDLIPIDPRDLIKINPKTRTHDAA